MKLVPMLLAEHRMPAKCDTVWSRHATASMCEFGRTQIRTDKINRPIKHASNRRNEIAYPLNAMRIPTDNIYNIVSITAIFNIDIIQIG